MFLVANNQKEYTYTMNLYDDIAQKMWQTIINEVKAMQKKGLKLQEIADILGVKSRSLISEWLHGNRKAENTSFANMLKYLSALNYSIYDFLPHPHDVSSHSNMESSALKNNNEHITYIPICDCHNSNPLPPIQKGDPSYFLPIPTSQYKADMQAVLVSSDGMEPFIKKGAYVGVIPFKNMREGAICLIQDNTLGLFIRRLKRDNHGLYLHPENPKYEAMPFKSKDYKIIGDVVWVWQNI